MRLIVTALLCICVSLATAIEPNLLTNGDMESDVDGDGVVDGWFAEVYRQEGAEGKFILDTKTKREGQSAQCIVHISEQGLVSVSQDGISIKPSANFLFRCWVKADCNFLVLIYAFKSDGSYETFTLVNEKDSHSWQMVSGVFKTPSQARTLKISLITKSKGLCWFDDAELILLDRPPYVFLPEVSIQPDLDGKLTEPLWQLVEPLTPFLELSTGKIVDHPTIAKIVSSPTHLFISFHCIESQPKAMRLRTPESKQPAYLDDCVEFYLDINHTHDEFLQFVVTPKGNRFAQIVSLTKWQRFWWLLARPNYQRWNGEWKACAYIGENFWSVEIFIPFSSLGFYPKWGQVIGANFCRSRKVEQSEQNSAFAYLAEKNFQQPQKFVHLVFNGLNQNGVSHAWLNRPPKINGRKKISLTPYPQRIFWTDEPPVTISHNTLIISSHKATALEKMAVKLLKETIQITLGLRLADKSKNKVRKRSKIILSTIQQLPLPLQTKLPMAKLGTFFNQRGNEAYVIFVGAKRFGNSLSQFGSVVLVGASERGVFNGVQTLRQLIAQFHLSTPDLNDQMLASLPSCEIWDYPNLKLRGWHFSAPLRHELSDAQKFLELLASLKFNTIVVEVDDRFPYERHPDIVHPKALTKNEWKFFLDKARKLGFEVIPQIQTFGHFGYVLNKPAYQHLRESNQPHPRWGYYAYCPSNPETFKLVFDLFDEVLEIFQPNWFHIGHDEITFVPIGICERCQGKPPWHLLSDEVQKLYDYLKDKGVKKVAMWCDQLEFDRTGGYQPYLTHFAIDLVPKDIVQFCWHYDARQVFPWLKRLRDKGFDVIACGWHNAQNVWKLSSESFNQGALGYCGTTWYGVSFFKASVDLMSAVVLASENSWSVNKPKIEKMHHPTNLAQDFFAFIGLRPNWARGVKKFLCLNLSPLTNNFLTKFGAMGIIPDTCEELDKLKGQIVWWEGVPFQLPKKTDALSTIAIASDPSSHEIDPDLVTFPVATKARKVYLLLTTTARPTSTEDIYERGRTDPKKVAKFVVHYLDGSKVSQDLFYRKHLTEWNDRLGCSHSRLVWQGKTKQGYLVTLCAYEWNNPKPNTTIKSLTFQTHYSPIQPVVVAVTVAD